VVTNSADQGGGVYMVEGSLDARLCLSTRRGRRERLGGDRDIGGTPTIATARCA
jgi:hypothetical protein